MSISLPMVQIEGPVHRLIPSKYPAVGIWDSVCTDADDLVAAFEVEALTNPRVLQELRILRSLPQEQRIFGKGATPLMAAICNPSPDGSRFADHQYGVYYAATRVETAIAETVFHTERFIRTAEQVDAGVFVKRRYECSITLPLPSISRSSHADLLNEDLGTYPRSQAFARQLRASGAAGLHYPSVRDPEGECVAVFDPRAVTLPVRACDHWQYHWDGTRITHVTRIAETFRVDS
jgi:hypothetical protein